jgi:hypothetical protein
MAVTGRREKESPHFKLTASCAEVRLAESRRVHNACYILATFLAAHIPEERVIAFNAMVGVPK